MSNDVARIKERLNIADVVGDYVRLTKAGAHFKARCPFHEEKTPSFVVSEERQTYHCFGCDAGGDVLSFVMEMEGLTFREALKLLADRAGVELSAYTPEQKHVQDQKERLLEVMHLAVQFYEKQLWDSTSAQATRDYLHKRGLHDAVLRKFHIGFAPEGWHHLEVFLTAKGFTKEELTQAGLSIAKDGGKIYDRFRARIMFPIMDPLGHTIGFSARVAPGGDESQAKYINTPESPLYHKSDVLYGIDVAKQAIKKDDRVIIVEGNVDVIAAHEAGIENIVAVSGTALTAAHIKILRRYTTNFTLFFDADAAGQKAARRSAEACFAADVHLALVSLSEGKDAADLVADDPEKLRTAVADALDALTFFLRRAAATYDTSTPEGKRRAVDDVLALAAQIAHPVERDTWAKRCAEAFGIPERVAKDVLAQRREEGEGSPTRNAQASVHAQESAPAHVVPTEFEKLVSMIAFAAMAFPAAWRALITAKDDYDFLMTQPLLQKLIAEGDAYECDIGALVAADAQFEKFYKKAMAFRDHYDKTYDPKVLPEDTMIHFLRRAQEAYHKSQIQRLSERLRHAEREGDTENQKRYMQQLQKLTQQSHS